MFLTTLIDPAGCFQLEKREKRFPSFFSFGFHGCFTVWTVVLELLNRGRRMFELVGRELLSLVCWFDEADEKGIGARA